MGDGCCLAKTVDSCGRRDERACGGDEERSDDEERSCYAHNVREPNADSVAGSSAVRSGTEVGNMPERSMAEDTWALHTARKLASTRRDRPKAYLCVLQNRNSRQARTVVVPCAS